MLLEIPLILQYNPESDLNDVFILYLLLLLRATLVTVVSHLCYFEYFHFEILAIASKLCLLLSLFRSKNETFSPNSLEYFMNHHFPPLTSSYFKNVIYLLSSFWIQLFRFSRNIFILSLSSSSK